MTISTTTIKNSFSGNASTSAFTYTFKISASSEMQVIIRTDSTGVETVKSEGTHYNVAGVGSNSGTVTFTSGNIPASGETVVLRRVTAQTQGLDLIENDPMPADNIETAYDKLTAISQELQEQVDRSLKISRTNTMTSTEFTNSATDRASKVLSFDSSGELAVTQELGEFKGDWAASTAYVERDIVKDTSTNNIFIVNSAHTSSGSQPLTTNTNSAKYDLIVDAATATTSATNAASSATAAASSATSASSSASTATTKASEASTSASNAASSATSAASSASTATTKASEASTSETNAGNSETAAASSATSASGSASTATTKASEAATSATNAASSASTATTKASEASTSATNAASSASSASTQASNASTSASTASTQATNAASSATAAATSATNAASSATAAASSATAAASSAASAANTVKVTSNDTTAGLLLAKLTAGSNITLTETNDGGNETVTVAAADNSIPFSIALGG